MTCATERAANAAHPTVETLRALADCEIDRRLDDLRALDSSVAASTLLAAAHADAITAVADVDASGLTALRATIDGDASFVALAADVPHIWRDYRVYLLLLRQAWLTTAADGIDVAAADLGAVSDELHAAVDAAAMAGKDTIAAAAQVDALDAALAQAGSLTGGVAAELLALTPAGYNAGSAEPVIRADRAALANARAQIRAARSDAAAAVAALRAL